MISPGPGWLRCEQFGAGMITGWGAHHLDTAHWAMGTEYTGPVEVEAEASFPASGLWNVHGDFMVHAKYANGVTHGGQRCLPQRGEVLGERRLDLCVPGQCGGHLLRSHPARTLN